MAPPTPAPPGRNSFATILAIGIAALLTVGAAIVLLLVPQLTRSPDSPAPSVTLGTVSLMDGNATFLVASIAPPSPRTSFAVSLRINPTAGTSASLVSAPAFAVVQVSSERYRVYWHPFGNESRLSQGDRFTVSGDGSALPEGGDFTFYLIWGPSGQVVDQVDWTTSGLQRPLVAFGSVSQDGNATFTVAGAQPVVSATSYRVNLRAGTSVGASAAIPVSGDPYVSITVGGTVYRVYWIDLASEGTMNPGDQFRVTGNNVPLTGATQFEFYLIWAADEALIVSTQWTTP